jgi:hypothetical protein
MRKISEGRFLGQSEEHLREDFVPTQLAEYQKMSFDLSFVQGQSQQDPSM